MYNRQYTTSEMLRISSNIRRIEFYLGHPLSMNLVDMDTLAKESLSNKEINTIVANVKRLEFMNNRSSIDDVLDMIGGVIFFIFLFIEIIESIF